jgi:outer membrane protein assembly factor BamA
MREAWQGSVFDGFLQDDLSRIAREAMVQRGHPMASVEVATTVTAGGQEKTAVVTITPGPQVERRLEVTGLEGSLERRFDAWLASGADRLAWLDAAAFRSAARTWLRSRGALDAEVAVASPVVVAGTAVRGVRVDEGTPYQLGRIVTAGVPDVRQTSVRDQLGLTPDESFDALEVSIAARDVERWYVAEGFRQVGVDVDTTVRRETRSVDLDIRIAEGPRSVVADVVVEGTRRTRGALLDRALALPVGTIATPQALLAARKRLYDTRVLSAADVEARPVGPPVEAADGTLEQPVRVVGTVTEQPRLRLRYGLAINDDVLQEDFLRLTESRRVTPGVSALLENRNLLGRALVGGLSARYERTRQSGRAFLTSPFLFGRDLQVQLSSGVTRSRLIPDLEDGPLDIRTDATVGVTQRLPGLEGLRLTYGYRYVRSRTYDPKNPDLFDIRIAAPRLTSTVFIDRRDDAASPTRGWFHASTVEVTRNWLGSDYEFVTYYGQQTAYRSIGRLVLAGRAQVGLGRGFAGQDLLGTERFEAGGAISVRGYRESIVGEYDEILEIARGDGLLVVNSEVRMPLWRWISGVAFVDGGGVFPRVSDFGVRDLQWGTGAGVRVSTPAGLVRLDVGVPLDRRPIDKRWRVYVGLGHIF